MLQLNALAELPQNAILSLSSLAILEISGQDNAQFLQGQLTVDTQSIGHDEARLTAQCDPKGKMVGLGHTISVGESIWFIQHRDGLAASLAQCNKYGVFANAEFSELPDWRGYLFIGEKAIEHAKNMQVTYRLPCFENAVFGWTPVTEENDIDNEIVFEGTVFDAYAISLGVPFLPANMAGEWIPQMTNVQALNGIDFDKGCYLGQETVARTRYLGKNKRQCFILKSQNNESISELLGSAIEIQMGENWRKSGTIINSASLGKETWSLGVLPNDLSPDAVLRTQPDTDLSLVALPYTIEQEASLIKKRR